MSDPSRRRELARGERVLAGVWRLRLPLPWPGVPHVNAWALRAGDGVVLFDTGIASADGMRQLELALAQVGLRVEEIRLLVCTHAHSDHYGLAGPIIDAAGCELWIHPAWEHVRAQTEDPDAALDRRLEVARQSGVPAAGLELYERARRGEGTGIARAVAPDRELVPGAEVETEHGRWQVHETPGHAPSHVVLHQPETGMLISGDHILGRISLFFDYGHTPDPVAEFITALDTVDGLETTLCLAGHGRTFRDVPAKVAANRRELDAQLERARGAFADGPRTAFEIVAPILELERLDQTSAVWGLQLARSYIAHLTIRGELVELEGEGEGPRRWRLA